MNFSSKEVQDGNRELHKWHQLQLKNDFFSLLTRYGALPVDLLKDKCEIMRELEEYWKLNDIYPDEFEYRGDRLKVISRSMNAPNSTIQKVDELKKKLGKALDPKKSY